MFLRPLQGQDCNRRMRIIEKSTRIYTDYCFYLKDEYENENTRHFYEYGMYAFLSFLERKEDVVPLEDLTAAIFLDYIKQSKPERQRGILCEIRKICRYLKRNDLLAALSGIHTPRHHRIIPVLETEEQERIKSVTDDDATPLRDSAMILLGLCHDPPGIIHRYPCMRYNQASTNRYRLAERYDLMETEQNRKSRLCSFNTGRG